MSFRVGIKFNLLYLVLVAVTVEKPRSNKYVKRKVSKMFNAF